MLLSALPLAEADAPAAYDLSIECRRVHLPAVGVEGQPLRGSVRTIVRNNGSTPLPAGQTADVLIWAVPQGGGDSVLLGQKTAASVARLGAGGRAVFTRINLPDGIDADTYTLRAEVTSAGLDEDAGNNSTDAPNPLTIEPAYIDLVAQMASVRLKTPVFAGQSVRARVRIGNFGNVAAVGSAQIELLASLDDSLGDDSSMGFLPVEGLRLRPGRWTTRTVVLPLSTDLESGDYHILAHVSAAGDLVEAPGQQGNNAGASRGTYGVWGLPSLADLQRYDELGASWQYLMRLSGSLGHGTMTADVAVDPVASLIDGHEVTTVQQTALNGTSTSTIGWYTDAEGAHMQSWEIQQGGLSLEFSTNGFTVAPARLDNTASYSVSGDITGQWSMEVVGVPVEGTLSGTLSQTLVLLGIDRVETPAGTFEAARVSQASDFGGVMTFDYEGFSFEFTYELHEQETWWGVPGVGVVKSQSIERAVLTMPGMGREVTTVRATMLLDSYSA